MSTATAGQAPPYIKRRAAFYFFGGFAIESRIAVSAEMFFIL
jgi:hypothetical protein